MIFFSVPTLAGVILNIQNLIKIRQNGKIGTPKSLSRMVSLRSIHCQFEYRRLSLVLLSQDKLHENIINILEKYNFLHVVNEVGVKTLVAPHV